MGQESQKDTWAPGAWKAARVAREAARRRGETLSENMNSAPPHVVVASYMASAKGGPYASIFPFPL